MLMKKKFQTNHNCHMSECQQKLSMYIGVPFCSSISFECKCFFYWIGFLCCFSWMLPSKKWLVKREKCGRVSYEGTTPVRQNNTLEKYCVDRKTYSMTFVTAAPLDGRNRSYRCGDKIVKCH